MPVIRRSESDLVARSAVVVDLGDLQREARRLEQRSLAQAKAIIDEARAERDRLTAGAAEKGAAKGHSEGLAKGLDEGRAKGREEAIAHAKSELEPLQKRWASALDEFLAQRDDLLSTARTDVLRFAVAFAERIVRRTIELNPDLAGSVLEAAIAQVLRPSRLVIECHPDDLALVERVLPDLVARCAPGAHAETIANPQVGRAGIVLRSEAGSIDASIRTQIDRLVEALLPGEPAPHDVPPPEEPPGESPPGETPSGETP